MKGHVTKLVNKLFKVISVKFNFRSALEIIDMYMNTMKLDKCVVAKFTLYS